ncbi:lytic transglycosylase domain-containing protein [Vibrio sp. ZSDZ65]|uniref:Lytic transglycosylase domain-containing protein n=1 Tax=Vibrio qingdaonensis TaxID=2829491 RepID=A0A9X3HZC8_9VIBR|nr:lytic transglycosylase domain-containing protein [Vibrio qingdaonensis]MCW8348712.1 lytic transglycosylase domain-containing protein [Vibrio qingdaonensis]
MTPLLCQYFTPWILLLLFNTESLAGIHTGARNLEAWTSSYQRPVSGCPKYCDAIALFSRQYRVPENLVIAVIKKESGFNPNAVSHKGAKGLMQLMDVHSIKAGINPLHPASNIEVGTAHLGRLLRKYDNIRLALAAYNAGEGAVKKYNGIPPYKETQRYVVDVLKTYQQLNTLHRG